MKTARQDLAVDAENFMGREGRYFAAVGSGTGLSASVAR
jgi:hypothetical protein